MKTIDIARRAGRSLRNAKGRTILTSLAIAVGAFTITVSLAAGEGARQYANKLIGSNVNPKALFIVGDNALFEGGLQQPSISVYNPNASTSARGVSIKQLTQADIDKLRARDDIESVVPTYNPTVDFMTFSGNETKFTAGVASYDSTIISESAQGSLPSLGQQIGDDEAVVPGAFVDILKENGVIENAEQLIGSKVVLTASQATVSPSSEAITEAFATGGEAAVRNLLNPVQKQFTYTVVAVSKQSSTAFTAVTDLQISPVAAREISEFTTEGTNQFQRYLGVTALVRGDADPQAVKEALSKDGFYAQTAKDLQGVIFTIVNTLQGIVFGFGVVALIASIFGIINTQYISVLERTREIGLMKALGMRGRNVSRLFQFEAAWIGFLGGVIGAAIAVIAGLSLNPWISEALQLGEGNYILIFQPLTVVVLIIALMIVAMLAGWFPARKAAKLDPIVALRTE